MLGICYNLWYTAEGSGGVAAQLAATQALAAARGIPLVQSISILDANIAPGTDPRTLPGFQQLTQLLSNQFCDTIFVSLLNRLAQDAPNLLLALAATRGVFPNCNIISAGGWDSLGGDQRDAVTAMLAGA